MKNSADVCIIGAGPAGTAAAFELLERGASVVLIDRHECPGGVKVCGGGLTLDAMGPAGLSIDSLPSHGLSHSSLDVVSPFGSFQFTTEKPFMVTIDRASWMAQRLRCLEKKGAALKFQENFIRFTEKGVLTNKAEYSCGAIIGADGVSSRVRRLLGIGTGLRLRAVQFALPRSNAEKALRKFDRVSVWFDPKKLISGYGWIFPAKEEIRIGLGAADFLVSGSRLKEILRERVEEFGVFFEKGRVSFGSIGCGYVGFRFGRVRLAGDAAGLASPVTGEGIGQALISGIEAAREIIDSSYRSEKIPELGQRHRRTFEVLSRPVISGFLLGAAPLLLRVPSIRKQAMKRYSSASSS